MDEALLRSWSVSENDHMVYLDQILHTYLLNIVQLLAATGMQNDNEAAGRI